VPTVDRAERRGAPINERTGCRVLAPNVRCLPTGASSEEAPNFEQQLANDRTVLAWVRTAVALAALGFRRRPVRAVPSPTPRNRPI
jgi:uncharacterized membrane protein YidH (DUF202 family)